MRVSRSLGNFFRQDFSKRARWRGEGIQNAVASLPTGCLPAAHSRGQRGQFPAHPRIDPALRARGNRHPGPGNGASSGTEREAAQAGRKPRRGQAAGGSWRPRGCRSSSTTPSSAGASRSCRSATPRRSAQPAGHKKIVAPFPTAARDPAIFFNEPRNAHRNSSGTARRAGLAADNGDAKARGRAFQTAIKLFHPGGRSCRRNDECDERELWKSRDRGEIVRRLALRLCRPGDCARAF